MRQYWPLTPRRFLLPEHVVHNAKRAGDLCTVDEHDVRGRVVPDTAVEGFVFTRDGGVSVPLVHYVFRDGVLQEFSE